MNTCIIRQPAGLGDIFFCQKIAHIYLNRGYEVLWPVIEQFMWIKNYIEGPTFIPITKINKEIFRQTEKIETDNFVFLPLQDADRIYPHLRIMEAKYKLAGIDFQDWQNYLRIKRNISNEEELLRRFENINNFIFINKLYGSPPGHKYFKNLPEFNKPTIEMNMIEGFSLIDWTIIMERACEIHTVDTCLNYLIEIFPSIKCPVYIYSRHIPPNFSQINFLFKKNVIYVK